MLDTIVDLETNRRIGAMLLSICLCLLFGMLIIILYLVPKQENQAYEQGRTDAYKEMAGNMFKGNVILNPNCN
jgi:hypothetical protein